MMGKTIKFSLLVILLCSSHSLFAQQHDFQTRLGLEASGDIGNDFGWSAKAQQRWRYNSGVSDRTLLQGGVDYSPLSYLKLGLGYRGAFIYNSATSPIYKQRMHVDIIADHRLDRFKLVYRSRLQYGFDDFQNFSVLEGAAFTWRHRLGVKYSPFGWAFRPQISAEIFHKLNTDDERALKGVRYTFGTEYLLNQHLSLSFDYILNKELNTANPLTEHVLYLGLAYSF